MADRCNYPSEIDMDGRMFGGEHLGSPYASPNVGANLVFAPYAQKLRLHRAILFISRSALQMDRVLRVLY
uniref:Uncharacterized protein n=1 Tax=Candidatus Kentrum sp. FM TaxID=2126340 RepID=A0A450TSE5_9GAMM|nr:MAG: hypothetical protein BECKFM1743A_GA0114220_101684 [Candidatus Kentron sp. FM]VFJ61959.1 MAG: hypothetical protein BECKFM1743A_GA0114220_102961 [Candidatus Kentron sp. FM]VFJ63545.1 MAG: hypothetical protein BECKFM1743C_GA0114222_103474 [Candidatus Kentron sp. FM]VFJ71327.1 MAG: hypothetical protein BECKFM1743A_GA0114220_105841 [Candidatus Kentron sp. FM]